MHYHGDQWSWVPDSRFAASGMTAQQYPAQPLRRDGKLCDRAGNADRIIDRGGDRRAGRIGATLAGALEAQEIERARRILGDHHLDRRHFVRGRNEVIGESDRERLAALVIDELLEQRAAEPLHGAAREGEASLWERDAASTRATSPSSIEDPAFPSARRISPSRMSSEDAAACSSSAAARSAFSRSAVAAIRVASPVITVTR